MSALTFDKKELGNLEYSLQREILSTDRIGGYMSTTIVCCNTRKYHGLMVSPIDQSDRAFVLLSSLDETIIQHGQGFNLALHCFNGVYEPRGHKYITDFQYTPTPTITYRVGGVVLRKELLWIHKRAQLMIRYTLVQATSQTTLRLRPFLAFRDRHELSKANMYADGRTYPVVDGVKCRLYDGFPWLYMQTNKPDAEFVPAPDWYYDFEYIKEGERGYENKEDLMTTGYFEMDLKQGESVIFSASLEEMGSEKTITEIFETSLKRRTHKIDFDSALRHSARQFFVRRNGTHAEIVAGYPWYGVEGRQTFMSLPGITLEQGNKEDCIDVLDTMVRDMKDGMFTGSAHPTVAVDAPLWFFWTLQELSKHIGKEQIWAKYGEIMKQIIEWYARGYEGRIALHDNGLIWSYDEHHFLSWISADRNGYLVEVNALWYNALCYTLELAKGAKDKDFVAKWKDQPAVTQSSFKAKFLVEGSECYMADFVNDHQINTEVRPNMVMACGLPYKMLNIEEQLGVLRACERFLLTRKGLRSLSPQSLNYKGQVLGTSAECGYAATNGAIRVMPLLFYVKACMDIDAESYLPTAKKIYEEFNPEIQVRGIASISEMCDGDAPHTPRGAISYASSVAALLMLREMVSQKPAAKKVAKPRATKAKAAVATVVSKIKTATRRKVATKKEA